MKPLIVIVSNRGPFSFKKNVDGTFRVERGVGGLVTALGALAEKYNVLRWVDTIWKPMPGARDHLMNRPII